MAEDASIATVIEVESPLLRVGRRFVESRIAIAALVTLTVVVLIAVFAPLISPQNPYDLREIDLEDGRLPPGAPKMSKSAKLALKLSITDIQTTPNLRVRPMGRAADVSPDSLTVALEPITGRTREYALRITVRPGGPLDPLRSLELRGLPRGATLSAGQKHKFRKQWDLTGKDIAGLRIKFAVSAGDTVRPTLIAKGGHRVRLMTYWLGTDAQGRDMLSAIFYGLRISLAVATASVLIALTIGTFVGLYAAYHGGRLEAFVMRLVDLQLSFPTILVALILLAIMGKGVFNVMLALVIVQWALYARFARGVALAERRKEYVEAAQCLGLSTRRVILVHILPNCMPSLIVIATLEVAHAISLEATLSFLGVGLPVTEPSLGLLISNGFEYLLSGHPWISTFPGVALLIALVSINLVGDELRDIMNPRLQR